MINGYRYKRSSNSSGRNVNNNDVSERVRKLADKINNCEPRDYLFYRKGDKK